MNIIYALIPLGLIILAAAVYAFFWAVRSGQFDDLETPAWSVVLDDDSKPPGSGANAGQEQSADEKTAAE